MPFFANGDRRQGRDMKRQQPFFHRIERVLVNVTSIACVQIFVVMELTKFFVSAL